MLPEETPIKIVRIVDRLVIGGAAKQILGLAAKLNDSDWRSTLIAGSVDRHETEIEIGTIFSSISLERLPILGRSIHLYRDIAAFLKILRVIRREKPSIVHTHKSKAGALGRVAAVLMRVPVIVHTFHGHVLEGYFSFWTNRIFRFLEASLALFTDRIVVLSDSQKRSLLQLGIGKSHKYAVIPSGLDLSEFYESEKWKGSIRKEMGFGPDEKIVGIIARLAPIKRHEDFLKAAAITRGRLPQTRFLIIGSGERDQELVAMAGDLGIAGSIFFLGSRSDLARLYADIDVVVLCSGNEGLPMTLIEAMACGKPVVATRVGGVPDLVQEGVEGFLIEPGDFHSLAEAIERLLKNDDVARTMGNRGRELSRAYSLEALADKTKSLYLNLLERKGRN